MASLLPIRSACRALARDGDRAELAAIVGFAAVGRAAEAEKAVGFGIGVEVQFLDLADTGGDQPVNDIAFKVEMRLAGWAGDEEPCVLPVGVEEPCTERLVHFVGRLSDAWPDRGMNAFAPRAEALHCLNRRVGHPRECAAPSGMGGADDDGFVIGEQDRRAVGGENPDQQVGTVGDQAIGARPRVLRPGCVGDDHLGGMDLMDRRKLGFGEQRGNGEAAIAGDRLAVVVAAEADVEAGAFADRDAAAAAEEAVRELAKLIARVTSTVREFSS